MYYVLCIDRLLDESSVYSIKISRWIELLKSFLVNPELDVVYFTLLEGILVRLR